MHIYQEERDHQDENRALAVPGGFQVDKDIAMSSGQLSQVRNTLNTTLEYYHLPSFFSLQFDHANILLKFALEKSFNPEVKISLGKFERVFHSTGKEKLTDARKILNRGQFSCI